MDKVLAMQVARKAYPLDAYDIQCGRDYPQYTVDCLGYKPLLQGLGLIVAQQHDPGYTGDSRVLYHNVCQGFGYLMFGWGSCSGCDALAACSTYDELAELVASLHASIRWMTPEETFDFFTTHDWKAEPCGNSIYVDDFIRKCKSYLNRVLERRQ